jgi:phosphoribosylpyrophosphate synthetase
LPLPIHVATLAPLLADVIARLHEGQSLSEFIARG